MDKDALYTARYAILTEQPIPDGPAMESILDLLRPVLGPEPDWFAGAVVDSVEIDQEVFSDQVEPVINENTKPGRLAKVALVVGHNASNQGAYAGKPIGRFEFDYNSEVAERIIADGLPGVEFRKFNRVPGGGYAKEISRAYADVNRWEPDVVFEMHFNGGGGDYVTMLAAKSAPLTIALAKEAQRVFVEELGFDDAGVFARTKRERGGASLYAAVAPVILTEPFFGDNASHVKVLDTIGVSGFADIYRKAIAAVLELQTDLTA